MTDDADAAGQDGRAPAGTVRHAVWVRGRVRTSVVLGDDAGEHVADLRLRGWRRARRRLEVVTDDAEWTVAVRPGSLVVRCGSDVRMTAEGDEVRLGSARLRWPTAEDGVGRGDLTREADGPSLLTVTPLLGGKDEPVAIVDVADDLPDPFAVTLAACAAELVSRRRGSWTDGLDPGAALDAVAP